MMGRLLTSVVCRRVCKLWRDIVPLPREMMEDNRPKNNEDLRKKHPRPKQKRFVSTIAARHGWVSLFYWLREEGCPIIDEWVGLEIVKGGHLDFLKIFVDHTQEALDFDAHLVAAAEAGHLNIFEWIWERMRFIPQITHDQIWKGVAAGGHKDIRCWLREKTHSASPLPVSELLSAAMKGGHLDLIISIYEVEGRFDPSVLKTDLITVAARHGHLPTIKWLREMGCKWDTSACMAAAKGGFLEILKWLRGNKCPWDSNVIVKATKRGNMDMLEWLVANKCLKDSLACTIAAKKGQLGILKWLREKNCPWNSQTSAAATRKGHLEIVQWAYENGCICNLKQIFGIVVEELQGEKMIRFLNWLKAIGCTALHSSEALKKASQEENWDACHWLLEDGCPIDPHMGRLFALAGQLELLRLAIETGCDWDEDIISCAVRENHFELAKWARQNGCPWNSKTCSAAIEVGNREFLEWAITNGCPLDAQVSGTAAFCGTLELLKWLVDEKGCPLDEETFESASERKDINLELIQWLKENNCPWNSACSALAASRNTEVAQWMIDNGCPWIVAEMVPSVDGNTEKEEWLKKLVLEKLGQDISHMFLPKEEEASCLHSEDEEEEGSD